MNYKDEILKTYEEALRSFGMSEEGIRNALSGFQAGYDAGRFHGEDEFVQQQMVDCISGNVVIN